MVEDIGQAMCRQIGMDLRDKYLCGSEVRGKWRNPTIGGVAVNKANAGITDVVEGCATIGMVHDLFRRIEDFMQFADLDQVVESKYI